MSTKKLTEKCTCTYKWQRFALHFAHKGGVGSFHELKVLELLFEHGRLRILRGGRKRLVVRFVMLRRDVTLAVVDFIQQPLLKARHFEALCLQNESGRRDDDYSN